MPELILDPAERARRLSELELVSTTATELTDSMLKLAQQLSLIHGRVRVANENSGTHFYLASPICLEEDGAIELEKCHLAVNVNKYAAGESYIAQCMKTGTAYDIMDLLSMPPLSERGYEDKPEVQHVKADNLDYVEHDAAGNLVPKSPGRVTPVYQLPPDHPAQVYLRSRGYDAGALWHQFQLSYGEEERTDMYYRKMLNGFRATPQGRLIFFVQVNGVTRGWQSRILELEHDGIRYYFHPYKKDWVPVLRKVPSHPKGWLPINETWENWDPVKYATSPGAHRNEVLMGYDAAVTFKRQYGTDYGFFMEGPLDAGRIGPPAMATIGKSLSAKQLELMLSEFRRLVHIPDADEAGRAQLGKTIQLFERYNCADRLILAPLPDGVKDLGALPTEAALKFAYSFL